MKQWEKLTRQKKQLTNRSASTDALSMFYLLMPLLSHLNPADFRGERAHKRRKCFDVRPSCLQFHVLWRRRPRNHGWSAPSAQRLIKACMKWRTKSYSLVFVTCNIVEWRSEKGRVIEEVGSLQQLFLASTFLVTPIFESWFGDALYYFNSDLEHSIGPYPAKYNIHYKM